MILPTKHLRSDRALIFVGGEVLALLDEPKTVSRIWEEFSAARNRTADRAPVSYDWFVLSMDLLFIIGAVETSSGRVRRTAP